MFYDFHIIPPTHYNGIPKCKANSILYSKSVCRSILKAINYEDFSNILV